MLYKRRAFEFNGKPQSTSGLMQLMVATFRQEAAEVEHALLLFSSPPWDHSMSQGWFLSLDDVQSVRLARPVPTYVKSLNLKGRLWDACQQDRLHSSHIPSTPHSCMAKKLSNPI